MFRPASRSWFAVRLAVASLAFASIAWALPGRAEAPRTAGGSPAYLSLGDSLAAGMQPDARGHDRPTAVGYADVVGRSLARTRPGLRTIRLSCGGATTATLMNGGAACQPKGQAGQLPRAETYLRAHNDVALVTVNIGDNDVEQCVRTRPARIDTACVRRQRAVVARNLPQIARRLRAAAGPNTPIVGIADYDQFLAMWLDGGPARTVARQSVGVILGLNALMAKIYRAAGVQVADAGIRFATAQMSAAGSLPRAGSVPLPVQRVCEWTWACSPPPINHDDHARAVGYQQIAGAILDTLAATASGGAQAP